MRPPLPPVISLLVACALAATSCSPTPGSTSGDGGRTETGGGDGGSTSAGGGAGMDGGGVGVGGGAASAGGGVAGAGGGSPGVGGGGGGGVGTGGGGSAAGGGSAGTPGLGTFLRVGFFDQHLAAGPDGSMHLTFMDGVAERVYYGRCQTGCGDPAAWSPVQLRTNVELGVTTVGPYGLGVDASGRVHLLLGGVPPASSDANAIVYGTCASSCGTASSWTFLDLSSLAKGRSPVGTSRPFMVEPNGRVSFFTSDPGVYFACASNCANLASWSAPVALNGKPLHAVIDGAGVSHVLLRRGETQAGEPLLHYARCASACTTPESWRISTLGFIVGGRDWTASLTATAQGRVVVAYNQGVISTSPEDNQKLFIVSCLGDECLDLDRWSTFAAGALEEGSEGAWLEAKGESVALATTAGFALNLRDCDGSCEAAGSWSDPVEIDASAAMNLAWPPDSGSGCAGVSESASWWPRGPTVGLSSRGVVVVHNPYAIVKCPLNASPLRMPPIGRVVSSF